MKLDEILRQAAELDASDIHLVSGHAPVIRVHTVMTPMDAPPVSAEAAMGMIKQMASPEALAVFDKTKDADFSYEVKGLGRYRVNAHMQRGMVGIAMRAVKTKLPPLQMLNLPEIISQLTYLPRGLVLVTGDTGSGKSTTLAAMIQAMNERYKSHIITLEDPVEYTFESRQCLIEQRPARAPRLDGRERKNMVPLGAQRPRRRRRR
ncbi:MAG: type IV pili twitching motility protein PilT, partial [Planctomycetes bacterium HGW-Planctomycetes-2]